MPLLENEIIRLRALESTDSDFLYKWENDTSLWQYGDTLTPLSKEFLTEYIQNFDNNIFRAKQLRLIIELKDNNEPIGTIDLYDIELFHSRTSIGILISPEYRGKGYASQSLKLVEKYVRHHLGLNQIIAFIPEFNINSAKLFKNNNYIPTGHLLKWHKTGTTFHDVIVMQKIFQD